MPRMTRDLLTSLATPRPKPVVSAYVPLDRAFPESRQNAVRLRDVVGKAADRLAQAGVDASLIERVTDEARRQAPVEGNNEGDADRPLGMAILMEADGVHSFELPFSCTESLDVGSRFHLSPLVPLLDWPPEFLLLTLSGDAARLFAATPSTMTEVELPRAAPVSYDDFMAPIEAEPATRYQSGLGRPGVAPGASVHWGESPKDAARDRRHEYVQTVAKALGSDARLRDKPLVLAAVAELHPVFRDAYRGDNLIEPGIHGSPDGIAPRELRDRASDAIAPPRSGETKRALDQFRTVAHSAKASVDPSGIVKAAREGRVETLIFATDERLWGRWDAATQTATPTDSQTCQPGDIDLIDEAVAEALQHGGNICSMHREFVPERSAMAAVLRWTT